MERAATRVRSHIYDIYACIDGYQKVLLSPRVSPYLLVECRLVESDPASSIDQEKNKGNFDQLSMLESAALFVPITLKSRGTWVRWYICVPCSGMGMVRLVADGGGDGGGTHSSRCHTALPRIGLSPCPAWPRSSPTRVNGAQSAATRVCSRINDVYTR